MNKPTYPSKKWSRKGQCPVCRVGTGSYHSVYCDWYVKNSSAMKLGKLGGMATAKKYGKRHFSEAGKKGMEKRWEKNKATYGFTVGGGPYMDIKLPAKKIRSIT